MHNSLLFNFPYALLGLFFGNYNKKFTFNGSFLLKHLLIRWWMECRSANGFISCNLFNSFLSL